MATKDALRESALFHFLCPDCGVGDGDWGHLVSFDEPYCMVCHMDDGRTVRLRRWAAAAETETPPVAKPPAR